MDDKDKRGPAFVAGATGFTGKAVVKALANRGYPVTAHVRPDSGRLGHWRDFFGEAGAEVDVTPWEQGAMDKTLAELRPSVVFALLGTLRARAKKLAREGGDPGDASYDAVDYGLTSMLIGAAKRSGSSPRFVYLSAAGVKPGSRAPYYAARAKAEDELRRSGLPYIIARPSFITGPGREEDRPLERMGAAAVDAALGVAAALGASKLRDRYASTSDVILAEALVRLALEAESDTVVAESEDLR